MVGLSDADTNKYETLLKYTELARQGLVAPQQREAKYRSKGSRRKYQHCDRLADDQVDQLVAAYLGGSSTYELAVQFGVNHGTVGRHLKSRGVQMRGTTLSAKQLDEAERLRASGLALAEVAEQIGVHVTTVRRRLRARRAAVPCESAH